MIVDMKVMSDAINRKEDRIEQLEAELVAFKALAQRVHAECGPVAIEWPHWECKSCRRGALAPESIPHSGGCLWLAAEAVLQKAGEL